MASDCLYNLDSLFNLTFTTEDYLPTDIKNTLELFLNKKENKKITKEEWKKQREEFGRNKAKRIEQTKALEHSKYAEKFAIIKGAVNYGSLLDLVDRVIEADPKTIVIFKDGTKRVAVCSEDDTYNLYVGILFCILKRFYPADSNGKISNTQFTKYLDEFFDEEHGKVVYQSKVYIPKNPFEDVLNSMAKSLADCFNTQKYKVEGISAKKSIIEDLTKQDVEEKSKTIDKGEMIHGAILCKNN